jgi:hypothetical protein
MKKMKKAIYILAVIGLILGACDKIEEPYLVKTDGSGPAPGEKVRKIILEEFTGHICVNCPWRPNRNDKPYQIWRFDSSF